VRLILGTKELALAPGKSLTVKRPRSTKAVYTEPGSVVPIQVQETLKEKEK
jgi:hypothetical protein